jgi:hypothetical protein
MKRLKDFTPEIQAKIPSYQAKALEGVMDGGRYRDFDIEKAKAAVYHNYEVCGYKRPLVLLVENPLEQQVMFNYICALFGENKELGIQLNSQLVSQLVSQLESQLGSQLNSQLNSQLRSQLGSQLHSQLESQLHSQLESQLNSQLVSQLVIQLESQLNSQLHSQLDSQLHSQLGKYNYNYLFTLNVYSDCYYTWYNFIHEQFQLPLDDKTKNLFDITFKLQRESGVYSCIFSEAVAVVCKYPKKVYQVGEDYVLHNCNGNAAEWGHSFMPFDCYYVNGRNISTELFAKIDTITFNEFLKLENEEDKAAIITVKKERHGNSHVLSFLGAELVDEQEIVHETSKEVQRLYKTKKKFEWANDSKGNSNVQLAWNEMQCPSTGQTYLIETCPTFNNVVESAKWLRPSFVPNSVPYHWQSAN